MTIVITIRVRKGNIIRLLKCRLKLSRYELFINEIYEKDNYLE